MNDFTKYAMGIITGVSVAVALGAAGNSGQQDEPRSSTRAKQSAVERQEEFSRIAGDPDCRIAVFEPVALELPSPWASSCFPYQLSDPLFVDSLVEGGCTIRPPWVFFDSDPFGSSETENPSLFYTGTGIYSHDPPLTVSAGVVDYARFLGGEPSNIRTKAIADVDGDGMSDLVIEVRGVNGESRVGFLKNLRESRLPLAGDLNGDCEVSGADLGLLLDAYGDVCP